LLEDDYFLGDIDDLEDFVNCKFVIEHPTVQSKERDDVHVEDVMMNLKFAEK
jgi:hypothetical protein